MPKHEIGKKAVDIAIDIMDSNRNSDVEKSGNKAEFHAELIIRNSTGRAKRNDLISDKA